MYGNTPRMNDMEAKLWQAHVMLMPLLVAWMNKVFNYSSCNFQTEKSKESTARVVCFRELGITMSYTLEASFYGPDSQAGLLNPSLLDHHMSIQDYKWLGSDTISCLSFYLDPFSFNLTEYVNQIHRVLSPTMLLKLKDHLKKKRKGKWSSKHDPVIWDIVINTDSSSWIMIDTTIKNYVWHQLGITDKLVTEPQSSDESPLQQGWSPRKIKKKKLIFNNISTSPRKRAKAVFKTKLLKLNTMSWNSPQKLVKQNVWSTEEQIFVS